MKLKISATTAYHSTESHRLGLEANENIKVLHNELHGARSDIRDLVAEVKKQIGAEYREIFAFHKEQSGTQAMTGLLYEFRALWKESREEYETQQSQIFRLERGKLFLKIASGQQNNSLTSTSVLRSDS